MDEIITRIELDIEINKKCLELETTEYIKRVLKLWIKYDEELLAFIKKVQLEKTI